MADNTNNIDIVVRDSVDSKIAPKLLAVAEASDKAEKAVSSLKNQLKDIGGSGLGGLLAQLSGAGASAGVLAKQTDNLKAKTEALSAGQRSLTATANAARQSLTAQATAAEQLAAAMTEEAAVQEAVNAGIAEFERLLTVAIAEQEAYSASMSSIVAAHDLAQQAIAATAQQEVVFGTTLAETTAAIEGQGVAWLASFEERRAISIEDSVLLENQKFATESLTNSEQRLLDIQTLVAGVLGESASATEVDTVAKIANAAATDRQTASLHKGITQLQAASGLSQVLANGSSIRAVENFISKTLGLGPLLQTIFPVVGAIAFIGLLVQMGVEIDKFYRKVVDAAHNIATSFDEIISPLRKTNDSLAVTNDRLDRTIAKLEHKPSTNGAQLALDEARLAADKLDDSLMQVQKDLDKILTKNRIGVIGGLLTGQSSTKDVEGIIKKAFDGVDAAREKATSALDIAAANKDSNAAKLATKQAYDDERKAILDTISTLNQEYNQRKKLQTIHDTQFTDQFHIFRAAPDQTANLTSLGKAVKLAQEDLRGLDETMANIDKNETVNRLRDQTSALKLETKLAAAEWKQLLADFVAFQTKIDLSGHKATPQESLGFLQSREATINPLNRDKLAAKELPFQNQIASQTFGQEQVDKLAAIAENMTKYGEALKETTELDRIFQEAQKKGLTLDEDTIDLLTITADYIQHQKDYQQTLNGVYREAVEPLRGYNLALQAANQIATEHPELAGRIAQIVAIQTRLFTDATQPLFEYARGLQQQTELYGQYGNQLEVSQEIQRVENQLRERGIALNSQEEAQLRTTLELILRRNQVEEASRALYDGTTGAIQRLNIQKEALNRASSTELSNLAKASELARINNAINDRQLQTGQGKSQKQPFVGALADYVRDFTTASAAIKQVYSETFATIADGVADSIGRAIVYAKSLGEAFRDVARNAIQELISGLIKVGLQLLVLKTVKALFGADDTTAKTVAEASATAAAWAPAASLASLATLGANSGPAISGILTTTAITEGIAALANIGAHKDGGLISGPGTGRSDSILARLSNGEYVVNAAAASQHRDLLDSINSGSRPGAPQVRTSPNGVRSTMRVVIEDHTSGVKFQTVQVGQDEMRVIARDAAEQAVHAHSDSAIANAINQPNSKTSKALRISTNVRRQR